MVSNIKVKEVIIILSVLIAIKFGINTLYGDGPFSFGQLSYHFSTITMDKIDTNKLNKLMSASEVNDGVSLIYMGRDTCPYCVESIGKIKTIFSSYSEIEFNNSPLQIKQYYFDTKKHNNNAAMKLRNNLGVEQVPSIVIVKGTEATVFGPEKIDKDNYEKTFREFINKGALRNGM